jgi:hypothetical protein
MPTRALFGYIAALVLGILTLFPYFLYGGGVVSSRLVMWVKLIIYAAVFFSPVRLLGHPQFRLVLVFCSPVAAISAILALAESQNFWWSLRVMAEPILCVWIGASLAWMLLRFLRLRFQS